MPLIFDQLAELSCMDAVLHLARRPARSRYSDARVLDPVIAVVIDCEPVVFRGLLREWGDRATAEGLAEAVHRLELERAAQPPVIEVTVTTPPEGIPRLELSQLVAEKVQEITGPLPALLPGSGEQPRRRRVLTAGRRARSQPVPAARPALPVSEDDTPTVVLPAIRDGDDGFTLVEVHVP